MYKISAVGLIYDCNKSFGTNVDHRRRERGRKRRKSTSAAIPNKVDVLKRGGSGESKEQQPLKPYRKIHSFRSSFIQYDCKSVTRVSGVRGTRATMVWMGRA